MALEDHLEDGCVNIRRNSQTEEWGIVDDEYLDVKCVLQWGNMIAVVFNDGVMCTMSCEQIVETWIAADVEFICGETYFDVQSVMHDGQ